MALIYFNNVVAIESIEEDLVGFHRVIAISPDGSMVALIPLPDFKPSDVVTPKMPIVSEIRKVRFSVLEALECEEKLRPVNLVLEAGLLDQSDASEKAINIQMKRASIMAPFLSAKELSDALFLQGGFGALVREAVKTHQCAKGTIYNLLPLLFLYGFDEVSLNPRFDKCGGPGKPRPCDGNRKKAGRKTAKVRAGDIEEHPQCGVTTEHRILMSALYRAFKKPGLSDRSIYKKIVPKLFATKGEVSKTGITPDEPVQGTYPNFAQFMRIIRSTYDVIERLKHNTTPNHFERTMRGMKGKSWQGIIGPGHQYIVDSTIADIYLVSSVNRAWICGRPIVYIVVDCWSSAVVGFFLCWHGPSWSMAKVALYCSIADKRLISELWGFEDVLYLDPMPSFPGICLNDRGEYLSLRARATLEELKQSMAFNPSYRPDLKGLVEVLNRITKDKQYGFVPGAINARRKEYDLRGEGKKEAIMTLREYARFLTVVFNEYNATPNRTERLDQDMIATGAHPSPAGLWSWGYKMKLGYRRYSDPAILIKNLLPEDKATISGNGVFFQGLQYESVITEKEQWTAIARNFGSTQIPIHYFPGSISRIWTPSANGFHQFNLSLNTRARGEMSFFEWIDAREVATLKRPDYEHESVINAINAKLVMNEIISNAQQLTDQAKRESHGSQPPLSVVRNLETEFEGHASPPSASSNSEQDQTDEIHHDFIDRLFDIG